MAHMPRNRKVKDWAEYLNETDQSVDDAIDRTSSFATAGFLRQNRYKIEMKMAKLSKTASIEASKVEFVEDEEVAEILGSSEASPNEPDEPQEEPSSSPEPQRGVKV
jgi:hypothetical protein